MNIRSASVPVNYEQTSATLIETNSLSRKGGPWRRADKFASGNGEKFPYRPNRFDSKHRDAIFVPPGYIFFFFLFPPFFSFFPPPSPLSFFIIRFSCHEVRIKKHRKRFSFARELAMLCVRILNVYPGNERNFDVCYLHLLCYFIAGSPVNTYLSPIFKYLPTRWHFSTVEERLQLISGTIHRDEG